MSTSRTMSIQEEEYDLPPDFYDDDEYMTGLDEPSFVFSEDDEPSFVFPDVEDVEYYDVRPAACARSNLETSDGIELCEDACVPGLCCLAERGRRIRLSSASGLGSSDVMGCRTDENSGWCGRFEGCKSVFRQETPLSASSAFGSNGAAVEKEDSSSPSVVSREIETQCNKDPVNAFSAEDAEAAAERCADACTPGLCCLADEGREASFSLPGLDGRRVTLTGCRSISNEDRCVSYLPCAAAFRESTTGASPNREPSTASLAAASSAAFPATASASASSSSSSSETTTTLNSARSTAAGTTEEAASAAVAPPEVRDGILAQPYAAGIVIFAFLALLAEAARRRKRRRRPSRAARLLAAHRGEYERVSLLDSSQHSTRSSRSVSSARSRRSVHGNDEDDSVADSSVAESSVASEDDEEGGDVEDPKDHSEDPRNILRNNWW